MNHGVLSHAKLSNSQTPHVAGTVRLIFVAMVAVCGLIRTSTAIGDAKAAPPQKIARQTSLKPVASRVRSAQHSATSNQPMTLVVPRATDDSVKDEAAITARRPAKNPGSPHLADLQQRKQESMDQLQQRAAALVQTWNARKAKEALAALKAQEKASRSAIPKIVHGETCQPTAGNPLESGRDPAPAATDSESLTPHQAHPEGIPGTIASQPLAPVPDLPVTATADDRTPNSATAPELPKDSAPDGLPEVESAFDGPIDRMALATSLFATGDLRECLQTLEAVDRTQLSTENQDWCEYVAACCFRKLGNLPEAESRYRQLLGHTEVTWIADAARWWLDHLNEQQKLRGDLEQLSMTLKAWQGEIDGLRDAD